MLYLTFRSTTLTREVRQPMRVRSKGRKNSKKGTKAPLLMFAAAEQNYAQQLPTDRSRNEGFSKYERFDYVDKGKSVSALKLPIARKVGKVESLADVSNDVMTNVNNLIRNILLFKGIGFADIEKDVRLNGKTTYLLNTDILIKSEVNCKASDVDLVKAHKITVKKTFRNVTNVMGKNVEDCHVFFDSDCYTFKELAQLCKIYSFKF